MDSQPTIDKRTKRRFIPIVVVVGVLVLVIVGVVVASDSGARPVGVIYLGGATESHGPRIALTNRTDQELVVKCSVQYKLVEAWVNLDNRDPNGMLDLGSVIRRHSQQGILLKRNPGESVRLHLSIVRVLPAGFSNLGLRLRTYWSTRQMFETNGIPKSQLPNPFKGGHASIPQEYFVTLDIPTNSNSL